MQTHNNVTEEYQAKLLELAEALWVKVDKMPVLDKETQMVRMPLQEYTSLIVDVVVLIGFIRGIKKKENEI